MIKISEGFLKSTQKRHPYQLPLRFSPFNRLLFILLRCNKNSMELNRDVDVWPIQSLLRRVEYVGSTWQLLEERETKPPTSGGRACHRFSSIVFLLMQVISRVKDAIPWVFVHILYQRFYHFT